MKVCLITPVYRCFPYDTTTPFVEFTANTLQNTMLQYDKQIIHTPMDT